MQDETFCVIIEKRSGNAVNTDTEKATKKKHLMLISLDAVSSDDIKLLSKLPNFAKLMSKGTLVRDVSSVFISNTYPAHTSIITGVHPNKHGLWDNVNTDLRKEYSDWRYNANEVLAPTLYQHAAKNGYKVCSIMYPVTGGAKSIRYNLPEIPGNMNILRRAWIMLTKGSTGYTLSSILRNIKDFKGINEPELDNFTARIACDTIIRKKPNVLMLHLIDADTQKHDFGPESEQAYDAIRRHDKRLGDIMNALEKAGIYEDTSFIVFSDHGCLPVKAAVNPNSILRENGLIRYKGEKVTDYDCYFHIAGGTAFLKLCNPQKEMQVQSVVEKMQSAPYFGRILTDEEMEISGVKRFGGFMLGIEAAEGYSFGKHKPGQHGYGLKWEGYNPFYLAVSDKTPQGETLYGGCITDICPLAADILNIPKWNMDGKNRLEM